ncbi:LysR family transcriptional regulator [Acinetobacter baumannii]
MDKIHDIPSLSTLKAFEAFGRLGSMRKAARALGIDHAAISRHLHSLEMELSVKLIEKYGNQYRLNTNGELYHQKISQALHLLIDASDTIKRTQQNDKLVIWCPSGFATYWLVPRIADFSTKLESLQLEIVPTYHRADFHSDHVSAEIIYCLDSNKESLKKNKYVMEIARPEVFPVASPMFIEKHYHTLRSPQDFLNLPLLHLEHTDYWQAWFNAQGITWPDKHMQSLRLWSANLVLNAACHGAGIAFSNYFYIGNMLKSGKLKKISLEKMNLEKQYLGSYYFITDQPIKPHTPIGKFFAWLMQHIDQFNKDNQPGD